MELRDLEYFSVLAKHGHLGRAAEALELSQSALSKSLRRLEHEMQTKLVKRTPKGVELTAEGSALLPHVQRLRMSLGDVAREVADVGKGLGGHLHVGAGPGFFLYLLPAAFKALVKEAPNVRVKTTEASQDAAISALRNGEVDVVITAIHEAPAHDLALEHLYDDVYVVIGSENHRLAGQKSVTLADAARERWVLSAPSSAISRRMQRVLEEHGLASPCITVQTDTPVLRFRVVADSHLLGYSWASVVRGSEPPPGISEIAVKELALKFSIGALWRKDTYLSPLAKRFIGLLKAAAENGS
jgi:DNA-binding transcriptional LysR family regulator